MEDKTWVMFDGLIYTTVDEILERNKSRRAEGIVIEDQKELSLTSVMENNTPMEINKLLFKIRMKDKTMTDQEIVEVFSWEVPKLFESFVNSKDVFKAMHPRIQHSDDERILSHVLSFKTVDGWNLFLNAFKENKRLQEAIYCREVSGRPPYPVDVYFLNSFYRKYKENDELGYDRDIIEFCYKQNDVSYYYEFNNKSIEDEVLSPNKIAIPQGPYGMNVKVFDKKYELVPETIHEFYCKPMYRIRALKDFSDVKKGQYGGYVESEENLSQTGNCWIYDNSIVCKGSRVIDNAVVKDASKVICDSEVSGDAIIEKGSLIDESSVVSDQARVIDSLVTNASYVIYKSVVNENSVVRQGSTICDAIIGPEAYVRNGAVIRFNIESIEDYVVYSNPFSYGRSLTASTKKDIWSCELLVDTSEKLRACLVEDEILTEDDEYLRWYDSIVAFHKNYFNTK